MLIFSCPLLPYSYVFYFQTDEIIAVPVKAKTGTTQVVADEFPRPGCTIEALQKLRPCFLKDGSGTVTAGNASGENGGLTWTWRGYGEGRRGHGVVMT